LSLGRALIEPQESLNSALEPEQSLDRALLEPQQSLQQSLNSALIAP
jgi:hypothetical protein